MPDLPSLLLLFLLASPALAQADYFPLQPGNQWIYRSSSGDYLSLEIIGTENADRQTYSVLRGLPGGDLRLRLTEAGDLVFFDTGSRSEKMWVAFSKAVGESYETAIDPCARQATITSKRAGYKGPVGEFSNGLRVGYAGFCSDAGFAHEIFLPYVGLLQRATTTFAGPRDLDLIYARLGGVTVISDREVFFGLTLDKAVYAPGEPLRVRLTLRHSQAEPLRLTFASGQTYEIVVKRESGEVLFRWSDGKAFTLALRELVIPAGEKNWIEKIRGFEPGRYIAEAWLTTAGSWPPGEQPARPYSASVGFEVKAP